ncbi:MAG: alpha-L-fucosidase [Planctomycetota bacterium]|jgi:alpha-L-fucosidase
MSDEAQWDIEDTSGARLEASAEGAAAFRGARFALSVHWGLYALIGRGEWVMHTESIPWEEYRPLMKRFDPVRFNAEEWADLMLESGQKFLVFTSKHHDGFCMWDTALTDFKVTNTPFGRDVIGGLAEALHARGLGLHFYYSILDWTHPAYRNDWPAYVEYYRGHLRELLSNYGRIDGIIFDGYWPRFEHNEGAEHFKPGGAWGLAGTYDLIHELQPGAMVCNNHHVLPLKGEDYQVFELDMPGENTAGFNTTEVGDKPAAVWWNLNSGWSYNPAAHNVKHSAEIAGRFREADSKGAVFFLNVGPRPFGDIHPDEQRALREIGGLLRPNLRQKSVGE